MSRKALIFHSKCSRDVAMFGLFGSQEGSWKALEGPGRFWGALNALEGDRGLWEGAFPLKTIGFIKKNDDSGRQGWEAGEESGGGFSGR